MPRSDARKRTLSLEILQQEVLAWARKNFNEQDPDHTLLGVTEECGELVTALLASSLVTTAIGKLNHHRLKMQQGIRQDEDHTAAEKDAVGDILIYLLNYCGERGISMEECLRDTWERVSQRDWTSETQQTTPLTVRN